VYTLLLCPTHAKCPIHLTLHDVITLITFHEEYRSWTCSLGNLLQTLSLPSSYVHISSSAACQH
jgi:hypothetical protein